MEEQSKKTVVLGATTNPARYSYIATTRLQNHDIEAIPIGIRVGDIKGTEIQQGMPELEDVHTVTLYLNPTRQEPYYDYILGLKPKRIIFNPGTENPVLAKKAREQGVETVVGCTLVMLSVGNY